MRNCANTPRLAAIRDRHNALVRAKLARAPGAAAELEAFRADMSRGVACAPEAAEEAVPADVIHTAFGPRIVVRRVGAQAEYAFTLPRDAAPHGEWWVLNPQTGWVPVSSSSRALQRAIEAA